MYQIHRHLIGSCPAMEQFRQTLPDVIAQYRASAPSLDTKVAMKAAATAGRLKEFLDEAFANPEAQQRLMNGTVIELCAQHFYGLEGSDFETVSELIEAIEAMDQELEFGQ